jgi:phi13 family phage major tail protein
MAKTGFLYTCAGILNETDGNYTDGRYLGPSATFNITVTSADVKDYGDNRVTETYNAVTGGTVSLELNEMLSELNAFLLGHKVNEETGEIVFNQDDTIPFIGLGAIGTSKRDGKNKYIAKFYRKIQLKEPNDENSTQQENVSFTHSTLEGNMFVPEDGEWKDQNEFDTLDEAKEWLNEKVGIKTESSTVQEG